MSNHTWRYQRHRASLCLTIVALSMQQQSQQSDTWCCATVLTLAYEVMHTTTLRRLVVAVAMLASYFPGYSVCFQGKFREATPMDTCGTSQSWCSLTRQTYLCWHHGTPWDFCMRVSTRAQSETSVAVVAILAISAPCCHICFRTPSSTASGGVS